MPTTLEATPASVTVHYRKPNGHTSWVPGYLHEDQPDGIIALVANPAAWRDRDVCRRNIRMKHVTRVEVHQPEYRPTTIEQILHDQQLTPRQRHMLDCLNAAGGDVCWADVYDLTTELDRYMVNDAIHALHEKGRVRIVGHEVYPARPGFIVVN